MNTSSSTNSSPTELLITIDQEMWQLPWGSSEQEVIKFLEPIVQGMGERLGLIPFQYSLDPANKGWIIIGTRKRTYLGHIQPGHRT